MKFSLFVAFVVMALALDSASAWICPEKDGFFRNPANPHKFYECVNGHDYEYTCPSNLVFNESIKTCDYTEGPIIDHQTPPPSTVPHGDRDRHTDPTTLHPPVTETVVTRGSHHQDTTPTVVHHETEVTRGAHHEDTTVAHHHEEPTTLPSADTTRGRHHE